MVVVVVVVDRRVSVFAVRGRFRGRDGSVGSVVLAVG